MTHAEIEVLLGVYALDAVDGAEAEAVELHLRDCVRCRDEVASHREMATLLAHTGADAPEGLWSRISQQIDSTTPALPPLRLASPPSRFTRTLAPALAMAAVVIAVLGFQVVRLDRRVDQLPAVLSAQGVDQAAQAALLNPDSLRIRLASAKGPSTADAVVLPDGHGYLIMRDQPALPYNQTYQLWGVTPGGTISLGVLGAAPNVVAFSAAGDLKALAVTVEKAGGVVSTEQEPVLVGALRQV